MPADERVLATLRGWIEKADNDLKNASLALAAGEECPADTAVFHVQQCAEKYLKALLAELTPDFQFQTFPGNFVRCSDAFIHAGLNATKTLWRVTPNG
jgi:hypothetical protein